MAGSVGEWERYMRWNEAIAEVVFSSSTAGIPTYLDLDTSTLQSVAQRAEPGAPDPAKALVEAVKGAIRLDQGASYVLKGLLNRISAWERTDQDAPPPVVALLALLSMAASQMHVGEGKASHNFYGRLADLLEVGEVESKRFTDAYRRTFDGEPMSQILWGTLNEWLERWEGAYGLPTAFSLAHAHVGLPLSQALVRRSDREKFGDMFNGYGLAPQSVIAPSEMQALISRWVDKKPCPASNTLERMWKRDATARERIVDVARLTLENWTGVDADGNAAPAGMKTATIDALRLRVRVLAFPTRALSMSLVAPARTYDEAIAVEILDLDKTVIGELDLVPVASGYLGLSDGTVVDGESLLGGTTLLRRFGEEQTMRRRSRRLVPLRRDDVLQAFVECERVQLGEDFMILVRNELASEVERVLTSAARPGFSVIQTLVGLPTGWSLIDGVQIVTAFPVELLGTIADLQLLQPLAQSQVLLTGGLRLPGNIRKWLTTAPPELRVSAGAGSRITAKLTCTNPMGQFAPPPLERSSHDPLLIWDLADERLVDGDYSLEIFANDAAFGRPEVVRLRSADSPGVHLAGKVEPIRNCPEEPHFGLVAVRSNSGGGFSGAPQIAGQPDLDGGTLPSAVPTWLEGRAAGPKAAPRNAPLRFADPQAQSCVTTGAHHIMLPPDLGGKKSGALMDGMCKHCGLQKRYPTSYYQLAKSSTKAPLKPANQITIQVGNIDPVRPSSGLDWRKGFDAVCHVGGGPVSALERLAQQMSGDNLLGDTLLRRLEALGHIEVERDVGTLVPRSWDVVPPTLYGLGGGRWILGGYRCERMLDALSGVVGELNGTLETNDNYDAPGIVSIGGVNDAAIETVAVAAEKATRRPVRVRPLASAALAERLPAWSNLVANLPRTTAVGARQYERWNPSVARFEPAQDASSAGAYRLSSFTRAYVYRTASDIGSSTAAVGDARIVKYALALEEGESLLGYDEAERVLFVPLGADLPGLYGRAAVLASGLPPQENTKHRVLEYRNVSAQLAGRLNQLLSS